MNERLVVTAAFLAVALAGCASTYTVNVDATPPGATLSWQGGATIGRAPQSINFNPDPAYMNGNCLRALGLTATWTSGATAHSDPVLHLCNGPTQYFLKLDRPANAPGLATDLRVAEMLLAQRIQQEQAAMESLGEAAEEIGKAIGGAL